MWTGAKSEGIPASVHGHHCNCGKPQVAHMHHLHAWLKPIWQLMLFLPLPASLDTTKRPPGAVTPHWLGMGTTESAPKPAMGMHGYWCYSVPATCTCTDI